MNSPGLSADAGSSGATDLSCEVVTMQLGTEGFSGVYGPPSAVQGAVAGSGSRRRAQRSAARRQRVL